MVEFSDAADHLLFLGRRVVVQALQVGRALLGLFLDRLHLSKDLVHDV